MICVDCGTRRALFGRDRCLECQAKARRTQPPQVERSQYHPDDHRGKRAALKVLIEAARKAGEL